MFLTFKKYSVLSVLLAVFASTQSFAQVEAEVKEQSHERLYQVELIVFARNDKNPQEHWPTDIKLIYPENAVTIYEDGVSDGVKLVPANERTLNSQAATLAKSGSYTLLYHQAWRQTIYGRKSDIIIFGGKLFNGHHELEGSISLSVAQYLKIQTNLWLTQFVLAGTDTTENWPELPSVPNTFTNDGEISKDYIVKRIVKLSQERTMRSNEVHYIDHPLMGVIVKITPAETQIEKSIN